MILAIGQTNFEELYFKHKALDYTVYENSKQAQDFS